MRSFLKEFYKIIKILFYPLIKRWKPFFHFYYWNLWKRLNLYGLCWWCNHYYELFYPKYEIIKYNIIFFFDHNYVYRKLLNNFLDNMVDAIYFSIYNFLKNLIRSCWKIFFLPIINKFREWLHNFFFGLRKLLFLWFLWRYLKKIFLNLVPIILYILKYTIILCCRLLEKIIELIIFLYKKIKTIYLFSKPYIIKLLNYLKIIFKNFLLKLNSYSLKNNFTYFFLILKLILNKLFFFIFIFIAFWIFFLKNILICIYTKIKFNNIKLYILGFIRYVFNKIKKK